VSALLSLGDFLMFITGVHFLPHSV